MDLKAEIQEILSPPHDKFKIIERFEELTKSNRKALLAEAEFWLLQLYEIDPHFFSNFLIRHLPHDFPELRKSVYQRAEKDGLDQLFRLYYRDVQPDEINQEIPLWIQQKLSAEEIARRIRLRYRYPSGFILSEASCIALYNYNKQIWESQLLHDIRHNNTSIGFEDSPFAEFRALVKKQVTAKNQNSQQLYRSLLRRFASEEEKRAEIRRIIETVPDWYKVQVELNSFGLTPNAEDVEFIKKRFSFDGTENNKNLFSFIIQIDEGFAIRYIQNELSKVKTESQAEEFVSKMQRNIWNRFYQLADKWILKVYELAPTLCANLVGGAAAHNIKISVKTAAELLEKVQRRNHREMLLFVNLYLYNSDEWNAELLKLAQKNLAQQEFTSALADMDCQPRYNYFGLTRAYITDATATALYRTSSSALYSFILHNLAPKTPYPLLLQASEGSEDYYLIFREVADGDLWKQAMQDLLQRNFPAEAIVTELERYQLKRRSSNGAIRDVKMDAGVLKAFVDKYGEAVLPFFERYVSWVTEGRLKALLALDIDRAELLRELNVIARREPEAFSRFSEIWALPLYERGASFFESFLIRYVGRGNEYSTRQLLARAKADKQTNLFRALYRLIVSAAEWKREVDNFIASKPTTADLQAFLELYDIPNWDYTLDDATAAKLYQYQPDLAYPFILRHVSRQQRWGIQTHYNKLLKATEANPEHHLAILKHLAYEKYWKKQIEALLKSNMSGDKALERLQELHPNNLWEIQDNQILKQVFEKYGAAVAPYIVEHIQWIWVHADDKFMEMLEKNVPSSLFWQAVFATINNHNYKGRSYKRWASEIEALYAEDLSNDQVRASLEMLSPPQQGRWQRDHISENIAFNLYLKYPQAAKDFIQAYYAPTSFSNTFFNEAQHRNDEEMLDFLSYSAMSIINTLIYQAFPRNPLYQKPQKAAQTQIEEISAKIIQRYEALHQREPDLYVRHAALTLAWWRPVAIWNAETMEEYNPIYQHFISAHLEAWIESSEALREVLESPNIFVQLIALKILKSIEHPRLSERILENKRIFRQLLLGRARLSTKRLALAAIEKAIKANPASASELLPILEEAADFYGRLALSEQMMISITRIKYALEGELHVS